MKNLILFFCALISLGLHAQSTGSIAGKLTDKEFNNEPLPYASVIIKGTAKGTSSDVNGLYLIDNLEPGNYTIVITYVGYETQEINAKVVAGKVTNVNVPMGASAAQLDEIVIETTSRADSPAVLLLEQEKAVEIKQSIGGLEISRKGISDAAGAIAKISGISKQEGSSNVYVRGLGDRYQNTTLNGLSLPSTDVNKKNIDLNIFSSDVIQSVGVNKTYSPRFFGDFSAGNVDIVSKSHTGKAYIAISTGSGINSNAIGESDRFVRGEGATYFGYYNRYESNPFAVILSHPVDPEETGAPVNLNLGIEGGASIKFKDDSKLSFFGAASFNNGFEYREGVSRDFTNVLKVDFPAAEEFVYSSTTTALANIDYRISDDNIIKFRSMYLNSSSDEVGYYGIQGQGFNRDANQSEDGYYQMNVVFNQDQVLVNQLFGEHKDGNWQFDWGLGYNYASADEPDRKRFTLQDYQFALDNDPNTNPTFFNNIPFDNQRFFQEVVDNEYNGYIRLSNQISENFKLSGGYNARTKIRNFNSIRFGYQIQNNLNNPITNVNNLDALLNVNNINIPDGSGVYNTIILNPISNNLGTDNVPGLPDSVYDGNLEVHSGFVEAQITLGNLLVVPGLRVENFSQTISFDVQGDNIPAGIVRTFSANENIFYPSLNMRYALNDDMNLRASFSKTASFPEFKEAAPFIYEDVAIRYGGDPAIIGGLDGNGATYSDIYNFDLKYEWFLSPTELISISTFYKRISDPINRVVAADATGNQRYFRTGERATVLGAELEVRKNILKDADDDKLLDLGFNISYNYTNQDLFDVVRGFSVNTFFEKDESKLEGASDIIANADLSFTPKFGNYKPRATIVGSYFSDRIFALGSGSLGDIVEKSVTSLDLIIQNPITDNLDVTLSATNLLNPDITFLREGTGFGDIIISEFKAGVNLGLSLKYKF